MAWLPAAATVAAAFIGSQGQKDANDTNREIQENNSAFNAEQAAITREYNAQQAQLNRIFQHEEALRQQNFQAEMASSVWQRGVQDMQAAGLNPMLAYSQGGNPSPQGASAGGAQASASAATAGSPGNMQNAYAAAGHAAAQWAQIENIEAQTEKTRAEKEVIESELFDEKGNRKGKWDSLSAAQKNAETGRINHAALKLIEEQKLTREQTARAKEEINEVIAKTKNLDTDTKVKAVNEVLLKYDVPRMKAEAAYFRTPVGQTSPHNKYGPQTPFRLLEGLGERILNRSSANPGTNDLERDARRQYGR